MLHEIQHVLQSDYRPSNGISYERAVAEAVRRATRNRLRDSKRKIDDNQIEEEVQLFYSGQDMEQDAMWAVDVWLKNKNLSYGDRKHLYYDNSDLLKGMRLMLEKHRYRQGKSFPKNFSGGGISKIKQRKAMTKTNENVF